MCLIVFDISNIQRLCIDWFDMSNLLCLSLYNVNRIMVLTELSFFGITVYVQLNR